MPQVSNHKRTEPHGSKPGAFVDTIRNYSGYRPPSVGDISSLLPFRAAVHGFVDAPLGRPPWWSEAATYEFAGGWQSAQAALEVRIDRGATSASPNKGALVGWRLSERPNCWSNKMTVGGVAGILPTIDGNVTTWDGLYGPDTRLDVISGPASTQTVSSYPGRPTEWPRFSIRVPNGHTVEFAEDKRTMRYLDGAGVEYAHTRPAHGWWGSDVIDSAMDNTGGVEIHLVSVDAAKNHTDYLIELRVIEAEWLGAWGDWHLDPTDVISGATAIDGALVLNNPGLTSWNWGANLFWDIGRHGSTSLRRSIVRVVDGSLPAGPVTAASISLWRVADGQSLSSVSLLFYGVKSGNTWGEGGSTGGASSPGECSWDDRADPAGWIGSAGCGVLGTDTESTPGATQLVPAHTSGPNVNYNVTLPASFFQTGGNGFLIRGDNEAVTGKYVRVTSDDYTAIPAEVPEISLTYTVAATGGHAIARGMRRGIGRGIG